MTDACRRIRSGLGDRDACATHGNVWPCQVRALSLTRPWTELVLAGIKPVENRSWQTPHRGTIVVHGAKSWDESALDLLNELGHDGMLTADDYEAVDGCALHRDAPTGYLGVVDIVDCHHSDDLLCFVAFSTEEKSSSDWAWAAGLFEGEGSIVRARGRFRLQLKMTDEDIVRRFGTVVGGRVYGPYAYELKDGFPRKPYWIWTSDTSDPEEILRRLAPRLGARRTAAAREVLVAEDSRETSADVCSDWAFAGSYHWRLANPRRFPQPLSGRGMLGLFVPPEDLLAPLRDLIWEVTHDRTDAAAADVGPPATGDR